MERLNDLEERLRGAGPAAALALRNLVGGSIFVQEVQPSTGRRRYFQGTLQIRGSNLLASMQEVDSGAPAACETTSEEQILIDFREPANAEAIKDKVMELWQGGMRCKEIAKKVGWSRNIVAEAVALWHSEHGLPVPDGRACRKRLNTETLAERIADLAKGLWDQGLSDRQIAARLECSPTTAVAAVASWHTTNRLIMPSHAERRALRVDQMLAAVRRRHPD